MGGVLGSCPHGHLRAALAVGIEGAADAEVPHAAVCDPSGELQRRQLFQPEPPVQRIQQLAAPAAGPQPHSDT